MHTAQLIAEPAAHKIGENSLDPEKGNRRVDDTNQKHRPEGGADEIGIEGGNTRRVIP